MRRCLKCNIETKNLKYCSRSCSASVNNTKFPKRQITRKCTKCDDIVHNHRAKLCLTHYQEYSSRADAIKEMTMTEYFAQLTTSKYELYKYSNIRLLARSWNKNLQKLPCAKCGYSKHVELCHIKPISKFDWDTTKLKDVNARTNLIQLCPNCHWEFDNLK